MTEVIRGRIVHIEPEHLFIHNERGRFRVAIHRGEGNLALQSGVDTAPEVSIGDIVEIKNGVSVTLTPNRTSKKTSHWLSRTLDPRRLRGVDIRSQVENGIREFFTSQGFRETKTPLLVPCPGMEPHIRPFSIKSTYLKENVGYIPTSPEFAMKRLLVGGLEKIFQICPAFRDEPQSVTHRPEFTILEWYRAYAGYEDIMKDTEELFEFLALKIFKKPSFFFQGQEISVKTPWPRLKIRDLFKDMVGVDLVQASTPELLAKECIRLGLLTANEHSPKSPNWPDWDDMYFKIWLNLIEPKLPANQAVFVTRYPASQAALSVIDTDPDGSRWARRFEFYAGGLELGNAFEELTDPIEQRTRFIKDMNLRTEIYGPEFPQNPLDEGFLNALSEGMPPSGGIAVGVDRMVMLYADESDIEFTSWLPFEIAQGTSGDGVGV